MVNSPTPRVQQVAHLLQQFTPQEIGQLVELVPSLRRPAQGKRVRYDIVGQDMREYVLKELAALGDEYRPMQADDPFVGGMSVDEFFGLPEEEQARLWDEQHQMDTDDFEERDVRADAQVSAR
jgi:hypothetical protein